MYLNIGGVLIRKDEIVGIFDLDTSTVGSVTKEFLKKREADGCSQTVGDDIPKAYVVTTAGKVFITTLSAASLKGRNKEAFPNAVKAFP